MPLGEKTKVFKVAQKQIPQVRAPEGFYSIWARWLKPLADYLTMSVQPLAYVIGDYTCHDGHKKRQKYIQNGTPPFCTCLGVVAVLVYHKDKIIKSHL